MEDFFFLSIGALAALALRDVVLEIRILWRMLDYDPY